MNYTDIFHHLENTGVILDSHQKDLFSVFPEYFAKKLEHYIQTQLFETDPDKIPSIPVHLPAIGNFIDRNEFDKPIYISDVLLIPATKYSYHAKRGDRGLGEGDNYVPLNEHFFEFLVDFQLRPTVATFLEKNQKNSFLCLGATLQTGNDPVYLVCSRARDSQIWMIGSVPATTYSRMQTNFMVPVIKMHQGSNP